MLALWPKRDCGHWKARAVGKVKIPYYIVMKGRGYWNPTPKMKALGFSIVRCGPDGAEAWKVAAEWNERWQKVAPEEVAEQLMRANPLHRGLWTEALRPVRQTLLAPPTAA